MAEGRERDRDTVVMPREAIAAQRAAGRPARPHGVAAHLDHFQRRHKVLGFPIAVLYKFFDDQGNYLSALITYYGFLSLFPLLLLSTTVLGFVLHGHANLQHDVLNSALAKVPVVGDDLRAKGTIKGSGLGLLAGLAGVTYGGLGIGQAVQNAVNIAWGVPRGRRPNPIRARGRSVKLLLTVGLGIIVTIVLSAVSTSADAFGTTIGSSLKLALFFTSVVLNTLLFVLAFKVISRGPRVREVIPGALIAAVGFQILESVGTVYVRHVVGDSTTSTNQTFALVLGLIAWIYVESVIVVLGIEVNVVRVRKLYPRALLTPFRDDVDLTEGDKAAYASYARAQQFKSVQRIQVDFDGDPAGAAAFAALKRGGAAGPATGAVDPGKRATTPAPGLDDPVTGAPGDAADEPPRRLRRIV